VENVVHQIKLPDKHISKLLAGSPFTCI